MRKKYRLAVLASHPTQYHAPFFRALSDHHEFQTTVYYCWDSRGKFEPEFGLHLTWDLPLFDGYRYMFLPNLSPRPGPSFLGRVNPAIVTKLRRHGFDAVLIHGYTTATTWLAFLGARLTRTPIIFWGETDLLSPRSSWKRHLKRFLLPRLFKRIDTFLYSCTENANYYKHYGVPESRLFFCPCAVDNGLWQEQADKLKDKKSMMKRKLGIPDEAPVILSVGKLIPRKRPLDLLQAFEHLYAEGDWWLVFVGDGPLRSTLQHYAGHHGLERVLFSGFKNQSEMPRFYSMADFFVLPSGSDPSPKALNEAMNFGLPVIVTDRVGTGPDLVKAGVNGFIFPVGDVSALQDCLSRLLEDPHHREEMGNRSLAIVSGWNFDTCVKGNLAALEYIEKNRA